MPAMTTTTPPPPPPSVNNAEDSRQQQQQPPPPQHPSHHRQSLSLGSLAALSAVSAGPEHAPSGAGSSGSATVQQRRPLSALAAHRPPDALRMSPAMSSRATKPSAVPIDARAFVGEKPQPLTAGSSKAQQQQSPPTTATAFMGLSRYVRALFVVYILLSIAYTCTHFYSLLYAKRHGGRSGSGRGGHHQQHAGSGAAAARFLVTTSNGVGAKPPQQASQSSPLQSQPGAFRDRTVVGRLLLDEAAVASQRQQQDANDAKPTEDDGDQRQQWTGDFAIVDEREDPLQLVSDDLMFSKLFQYALKPSKIVPYYYRKTHRPASHEDITITTMITIERLPVFQNLVQRFRGPVSVALHIMDDETKADALQQLHRARQQDPVFRQYVDVHLIVDRYDRQFNLWRNVARMFAGTELVMTMDVDFLLCTDLVQHVLDMPAKYRELLYDGTAVFVVPAFEFTRDTDRPTDKYPAEKRNLTEMIATKEVAMFHNSWKRGHGPTNYGAWMLAREPYRVHEYNYNYEPYVLMKRDGLPWCDERFVGYGANKAACLYEIYLSGTEFWVLPFDFLIHQHHPYPENDRRVERKYNRRLYDAYREEVCFRYGRMSKGVQNSTYIDERICGINFPNYFGL